MARNWKPLVSKILRSWTARFGFISILLRFIPDIRDWFDAFIFIKGNWSVVIDFLGSGWGTLITMGIGTVLIYVALRRTLRTPEVSFPKELRAEYDSIELDLNGVEDHIIFRFTIQNTTPHDLVLTGVNRGILIARLGSFNYRLVSPWLAKIVDASRIIRANGPGTLIVTRILELGIAYEFAFAQKDRRITFNFADMKIGIKSESKSKEVQYGVIMLPNDTEVEVPESPLHWQRYRDLHNRLKRDS